MQKLTDTAIRSAALGTYWDPNLPGFGIRIGQRTKTFLVLVDSGRRHSIGHYPAISLADARREAKRIQAEKELGKVHPTHFAWDDAKAEYLAHCAMRASSKTVKRMSNLKSSVRLTRRKYVSMKRRRHGFSNSTA